MRPPLRFRGQRPGRLHFAALDGHALLVGGRRSGGLTLLLGGRRPYGFRGVLDEAATLASVVNFPMLRGDARAGAG